MTKPLNIALGLLFAICPLITVGAYGEAPNLLTYQGRLKEGGQAVTGNRAVEIFLCDDETAGTCHTSGSQPVAVSNGLFRSTFTIPGAANFGAGNWWLKINVGGTDLTPRERLTSGAYALFAATAAYASNISAASGSNGVTVSSNLFVGGNNFTVGVSTLSVGAGKVGIGTVNPAGALEIYRAGSGQTHLVLNNPSSDVALFIKKTALRGILGMPYYDERVVLTNKSAPFPGTADPAITLWDDGHMDLKVYSTGYINLTGGNVGISSATPRYRLVVSSGAGEAGNMLVISTGSSSVIRMTGAGEIYANYFSGDGSLLTNLPAAGGGVAKTGDTMTGQLTLNGSTLTILGSDSTPASLWVSTGSATPHLYVSTGGNIGIGTATLDPNWRLTVAGIVRITGGSGGIIFPDGTFMNSASVGGGTLAIASGGTGATDAATARTNLGLAIGTDVHAYDADLTTFAGITPSANVVTMLGSANNAAILSNIGAQAADADLTTYAGITPSANIQTLLGSANNAAAMANLGALAKAGDNMTGQLTLNGSSLTLRTGGAINFAADETGHVGINAYPDNSTGLNIYGTNLYEPGIRLDYGGQVWALHNNNGPLVFTKTDGDTTTQLSLSRAGDLSVPNGAFSVGTSTLIVRNEKVGIGNADPVYQLDVLDSIRAYTPAGGNGRIILGDGDINHGMGMAPTTDTFGLITANSGTGGLNISGFSSAPGAMAMQLVGVIGDADPTDSVPAVQIDGAKKSGVTWQPLGAAETILGVRNNLNSNLLVVMGDGDVGVGTVNPGYKLHLQDPGALSAMVESQGASTVQLFLKNSAANWGFIVDSLDSSKLKISLNSSPKMSFSGSDVGIGTVSPGYRLDVQGGYVNASGGLCIADNCKSSWASVGDNLGDHIATQNLNMAQKSVLALSSVTIYGSGLQIATDLTASGSGIFISTGGAIQTTGAGHGTVAGNPRGLGAIDLQNRRLGATYVAAGDYSIILGGASNKTGVANAVIAGGELNDNNGTHAFIGAGYQNAISIGYAAIGGGFGNTITATAAYGVIGGGSYNLAAGGYSTVSGGEKNNTSNAHAVIAGGKQNHAGGLYAVVPGGYANTADGNYSFAAGAQSSSTAQGAFTWNDSGGATLPLVNSVTDRTVFKNRGGFLVTGSTNTAVAATVDRGVLMTGDGLLGVGTAAPGAALDVVSSGTAPDIYAQIWRNGSGVIVASVTSQGVMNAAFNGPSFSPVAVKGGDYTALLSDEVILINAGAVSVTLTLPAAASATGKKYTVKAVDVTNSATIEPAGAETLDGAGSYGFLGVNEAITIISDGANWFIIGNN